ncbi:MAG: SGNH/GDSL hydrolase family protein [Nitrospinota bacterium]|nr:SGNH/GDSL hydrolase family protein [Nitrospinota bacterium]
MKKKILYPIVAILLALVAMEAAAFLTLKFIPMGGISEPSVARQPMDPNGPLGDYKEADKVADTVISTLKQRDLMRIDQEMIFRVRPNPSGRPVSGYHGVNSLGFRGGDFEEADPDEVKIMIVRDSNGFGWGLHEYEETWPARLDGILAAKGVKSHTYNISQPGFSTHQARMLFGEWFDNIRPDFVIFFLGWNDIWSTPELTDEETIRMLRINNNPLIKAVASTYTYAAVKLTLRKTLRNKKLQFARQAGYGVAGMKTRVPLGKSIENMEAMALRAIEGDAKPVIVLLPYAMMMNPGLKAIDKFNSAIFDRFKNSVVFVKLDPMRGANPRNWKYFFDDGFHANASGAKKLAGELADAITGYSALGQSFTVPREWVFQAFAMPKEIGGEAEDTTSLTGMARVVNDPQSTTGALVFGPYIRHECAHARASFRLKTDKLNEGLLATIDVTADEGRTTLASMALSGSHFVQAGQWATFELYFSTPAPVEKLETRVYYHGRGAALAADVIRVRCM